MASAVVGRIVFRLSIFFLGEVRESGDGPKESRRHVHPRRSFPWSSELSQVLAQSKSVNLAQVANTQYILSNYHVFESDIIPGGDNTVAPTGDPIIQPGLIDVNCNVNGAQTVATLVKKSSLPNSNVDCSIGKVVTGQVRQQRLDSGDWHDFEDNARCFSQPSRKKERPHYWTITQLHRRLERDD